MPSAEFNSKASAMGTEIARLRPAFLEKYLDRLLLQLSLLGDALEDNAGQADHKPSKSSILFQQ